MVPASRVTHWLLLALAILVAAIGTGLLLLDSRWAENRARQFILSRANEALAGELRIERLSGSMIGGDVRLDGVALVHAGLPVFSADEVRLRYSLPQMISGLTIADVTVVAPRVVLAQDPATGKWNVTQLTRGDSGGERTSFDITRLRVIDGDVVVRPHEAAPRHIIALAAELGLHSAPDTFEIDMRQLSARDADTGLALEQVVGALTLAGEDILLENLRVTTADSRLAGRLAWEGGSAGVEPRITFDVEAAPIAAREIVPYVPALADVPASAALTFHAAGSLDGFTGDWTLASEHGNGGGKVTGAKRESTLTLDGTIETTDFNPARWLNQPALEGDVALAGTFEAAIPLDAPAGVRARFDADLDNSSLAGYRVTRADVAGTYSDEALVATIAARAYGATVTLDGRFETGSRRWRGEGRFASLDVAALPSRLRAPRLATDLAGHARADGGPGRWAVHAVLDPSIVEGAQVAEGFTADVAFEDAALTYAFNGSVAELNPRPFTALLTDPPEIVTGLAGTINADLDVSGRGTQLSTATIEGTVRLRDSHVTGVTLDDTLLRAALADGTIDATIEADHFGVSDNPLGFQTGPLEAAGSARLHALVPGLGSNAISLESVRADGTITIASLTARDTTIDRAELSATLRDGSLQVAELDVAGSGLTARASGVLAVAGQARSDLALEVIASDLTMLAGFVEQPLEGGATIEARVTGAARHPSAVGTIRAHDFTGGPVSALTFAGSFNGTVPDLVWTDAAGRLDATATFVEVSGNQLDEVVAELAYDAGRLDVDATVAQGPREFAIAGVLEPHPDHREVHLRRLALVAAGTRWELPAGGEEPVIQYAPGRVDVRGFALVSGTGTLRVEGSFGEGSQEPLRIVAENVGLQDVNQMALGTHTFEGAIDLTAEVTGTQQAPVVTATFGVDGGSIDGQPFQSIAGTGGFRDHQVTLDLEMDAGVFGRFAATGTLPLGAGAEAGTPLPPYDIAVKSSALDLTFFQPLTDVIDRIGGTGSVDLRVTGPASTPSLGGTVALSEVTFRVPATGVTYQHLNADLIMEGQQLTVDRLVIEDSDGHQATVTGLIDVPGLGDENSFELLVNTDELFVMQNELGEIAVSANLQALGDLQTPLVAGTITVDRGLIEVSDLLERLASTGYEASSDPAVDDGPGAGDGGAEASPYTRSSLSVTLAMPGNLVVRGRDIRGGSGPIGLGDVNVTLDGALLIAKETGEEPALIGSVDVVRGQYDFQGRQFTIQRGSEIAFQGTPSNPALDITAEREVSGVIATVHLEGTLARPELELSSDPPLDEGDILALIAFNRPMNQLGSGERVSLGVRAAALAAGAIATPISDSVARALDLDVFEIEPTAEEGGGASVTVGRQVSDNLFLGFSQEFGPSDVSQLSFEYRLNEYLSIITSLAHGADGESHSLRRAEEAGIDLIFRTR